MNKSILVEQIKKFSSKEVKDFGEFVDSPFFNKNQGVIKLYDYIRKQYPDFNSEKMKKEYVYSKVFPKAEYNDGFMRTLMFNLSNLAEEFFAYCGFKSKQFSEKRYLLHELNERGLDRQIEKNMKEILNEFSKVAVVNVDFYYNKFALEYEYFYYLTRIHFDKPEKFINNTDIVNIFSHLTYFYLLHVLKFYIYFLNIKNIFKVNFNTGLIKDFIENMKPGLYAEEPLISLYYNILMLHLKEDEESYFDEVQKIVKKYENMFETEEALDAYINLENYCKRMMRKGKKEYQKKLFDIYKNEIKMELYKAEGKMSSKFFRSVVETGLKLNEKEWTKDFIESCKTEMPGDAAENTYFYALSLFEFAARNYEKALELLSKVKYNDIYHKTEVRCLITEIYYELNMEDVLASHLDSFRHFITNDRLIAEERKEYFSNFVKYARNLNSLKNKKSGPDVYMLKRKAEEETVLYNKEWILEKINELETGA